MDLTRWILGSSICIGISVFCTYSFCLLEGTKVMSGGEVLSWGFVPPATQQNVCRSGKVKVNPLAIKTDSPSCGSGLDDKLPETIGLLHPRIATSPGHLLCRCCCQDMPSGTSVSLEKNHCQPYFILLLYISYILARIMTEFSILFFRGEELETLKADIECAYGEIYAQQLRR